MYRNRSQETPVEARSASLHEIFFVSLLANEN